MAITDLKTNFLVITEKMASVEAAGKHRERAIHRLGKVTTSQSHHLIEINRHLEDLDKRGRRNKIRVRGSLGLWKLTKLHQSYKGYSTV